jgi:hypothetical protein
MEEKYWGLSTGGAALIAYGFPVHFPRSFYVLKFDSNISNSVK